MYFVRLLALLSATILLSGCTILKKPEYAGIQVITNDAPSAVFLNNQHLNNTPLNEKTIQPGKYAVRIVPENPELAPYETTVTLRAGLLTVITWKPAARPELSGGVIYEMEPLSDRNKSEVSFITIPDGAIINFEGKEKTFSPTLLTDINPGQYQYEISLPSYETQKHTINVAQGHRMLVTAKLAKTKETDSTPPSPTENTATPSGTASSSAQTLNTPQVATSSATATAVLITKTGYFLNGKEVLRVRSKPGATGTELGFIEVGEAAPFLGETQSDWYKITFKDEIGWVSAEFSQLIQ